jgi:ribulose-5-phosphate 4-epimerase/fuculose-1-phosphate aldolase
VARDAIGAVCTSIRSPADPASAPADKEPPMLDRPTAARPPLVFDEKIAEQIVRYGRMLVKRGYIHNSLGNVAIRVPHPDYPHGIAYTKHSTISLEEMTIDNVVITDIPTTDLLHGTIPTSVGHKLNREIFRLRPDVGAVIHVHHDETLAWLGSKPDREIKAVSLEYPYVMAKPPCIVPSHLDVEQDVGPLDQFVHGTNALVMIRHGITTFGRNVSEAYHRLNTLTSEIRRNVLMEILCKMNGTEAQFMTQKDVDWMYSVAESVIYPTQS